MKVPDLVDVREAHYVGDYVLRIRFSDESERTVDFGPFLKSSSNPLIQAYLDPERFAQFSVREGDLVWGDYELCFPIADLYEGKI